MTRNILSEIAMLSTLDHHHRIVAYLGASYRSHPILKEDHLFIITEFMEGVSNREWLERDRMIIKLQYAYFVNYASTEGLGGG